MSTLTRTPDQRIVLEHIPWEVYEGILAAHRHCSVPRFTYDQGRLEIMSPSPEHGELQHMVALFVEIVAEELHIDIRGFGSTTFRRADLQRGFEPDGCFYVQNAERMQGKTDIDLTVDPPPDIIIEVDFTSPSLQKFPIFAQLRVPEVWRYDGDHWCIFHLADGQYSEQVRSRALPVLTATALTQLLAASLSLRRLVWLRQVRDWVREHGPGAAQP